MVAAEQHMHERRVGFVSAKRQLRAESVGVVVEADAILGGKARAQISRDAEIVVEVPRDGEIETVSVDSAFQMRVLITTEDFRLRIVPGLSRHGRRCEQSKEASDHDKF